MDPDASIKPRSTENTNFGKVPRSDGTLWVHFGYTLGTLFSKSVPSWVHFGCILGTLWVHFFKKCTWWVHYWCILGTIWVHFSKKVYHGWVHFCPKHYKTRFFCTSMKFHQKSYFGCLGKEYCQALEAILVAIQEKSSHGP